MIYLLRLVTSVEFPVGLTSINTEFGILQGIAQLYDVINTLKFDHKNHCEDRQINIL